MEFVLTLIVGAITLACFGLMIYGVTYSARRKEREFKKHLPKDWEEGFWADLESWARRHR